MTIELKLILMALLAIIEFPIVLFVGYQIGKYSREPEQEAPPEKYVSEDVFPPKIESTK